LVKKAIRCEPWGYKERAEQPFPTLGPFLAIIDQWQKKGTGAAEKAASQRPGGSSTG